MDPRAALTHQTQLALLGLLQTTAAVAQERKAQLEQFVYLLQMLEDPPRPQPIVREQWVKPGRTRQWWANFEDDAASDEDWLENFRMRRSSVCALSDELRPHLERKTTVMRAPISVLQQVACTLFYLRGEGRLSQSATAFGLSTASVSNVVRRTCKAISGHLGAKYVRLPFSDAEVEELVTGFEKAHGMPQCLGAVDATHIQIKQPSARQMDYSNKKGTFSLNVQAVCDYKYMFMDVVVKWPGSVHESSVFLSSKVNAYLKAGTIPSKERRILDGEDAVPVYLVGGATYPLLPYLMKDAPDSESEQETHFERSICRAHKVMECALGRLKARFGALRRPMDINLRDLPNVIFACFVLHNFCELNGEELDEDEVQRATRHDRDTQPPKDPSSVRDDAEESACQVKAVLTKYLDS